MSHRNDFAVIDAHFVFGCHRQWTVDSACAYGWSAAGALRHIQFLLPALDVVDLNPFQYGMGYVDSEAIKLQPCCRGAGSRGCAVLLMISQALEASTQLHSHCTNDITFCSNYMALYSVRRVAWYSPSPVPLEWELLRAARRTHWRRRWPAGFSRISRKGKCQASLGARSPAIDARV